jgi:hypothetical protein
MSSTTIIGVDPGIVDTGVVRFTFYPTLQRVGISSAVVPAFDLDSSPQNIASWIRSEAAGDKPHVFVEKYNPRPGMRTNDRMKEIENALIRTLPHAVRVNNMGIKQVITQATMDQLHVWYFSKVTHHQDLRSAARIGLYGAVKDDDLNHLVAAAVMQQWPIDKLGTVSL